MGDLAGDEVGEAYGAGGLGLAGIGEGGGGGGAGTIGLGSIGTIGHGSGTGIGYGYGSSCGGLGGRRATAPSLVVGSGQVRGSCDADLIRRVVRAHLAEVRFCYEQSLQSHPEMTGRVMSHFVVGGDGRVSMSSAEGAGVDEHVSSCVAHAIARWQFAPRCASVVNYPFTMIPADAVATRAAP
jgi:hypothetical protein